MTAEVEELLRVLGPFYELVDEKKKITQISDLSTGTHSLQVEVCPPFSQKQHVELNLFIICLLSCAQPV